MAMLVVYCLKGVFISTPSGWVPYLAASIVTVLLHVWRKNSLISIVGGTAVYMVLVQFIFPL